MESCVLEQICGFLYVHFEIVLGFTRNEQMRCLKAFLGTTNCVKYPRNVTSYFSFPRNISKENMDRPGEVQKMSQKQPKLKVIIHAFGLSQGPSFECRDMPLRDMGGHWKGVMWLGTNMWMPLYSFRGNFWFHAK